MDIKQVNVILCSEKKTDKFYSMEIVAPEEREKKGKARKSSRSIFVHAETAKVSKFIIHCSVQPSFGKE